MSRKSPSAELLSAAKKCKKLGFPQAERILLFCLDKRCEGCASRQQMVESWKYLKKRSKELRLRQMGKLIRIRTGCLGICRGGPIIGILPDGVWYGGCTPNVIDRILQEHVIDGTIVDENAIAISEDTLQDFESDRSKRF